MTRPNIASAVRAVCPQSGRAASECDSEDNCLPEGNQGFGGCVPVGRGLENVVVRRMRVTPTDVTICSRFRVLRSWSEMQL